MGRRRDNTARKEGWNHMATTMQGKASHGAGAAAARAPVPIDATRPQELDDDLIMIDIRSKNAAAVADKHGEVRVKSLMERVVQSACDSRAIAPLTLLAVLVLVFLFSPLLPIGVRDYISALIR